MSKNPLVTLAEILLDDRRDLQKGERRCTTPPSGPCGRLTTQIEASSKKAKKHTVAGLEFAKEQLKDSQTVSKPRGSSGLSSDRLEEAKHLSSPIMKFSANTGG